MRKEISRGSIGTQNKQPIVRSSLMIKSAKFDRQLTQVTCRITNIVRLKHVGVLSTRNADQQLKNAVEHRAELMRQIDSQDDLVFDA